MKTEYIVLNQERNVSLTAYLQPAGRAAIQPHEQRGDGSPREAAADH